MIQRGGELILKILTNVQKVIIEPIIKLTVKKGTLIYSDEYAIYSSLKRISFKHKTVNHDSGEFACDEDGDGFYQVHVNTIEGTWSLLRSWLRPHRGISQEKLPLYIAFSNLFTTQKSEVRAC
jgi:transposase-like protein